MEAQSAPNSMGGYGIGGDNGTTCCSILGQRGCMIAAEDRANRA